MTKPNGHHQFDLLYVPHNVFEVKTHKYILTGVDVAKKYKVSRALRIKKPTEITLVLEAIYQKWCVFKYPKVFLNVIMGLCLKAMWQNCLKQNVDVQSATRKYQHTHTALGERTICRWFIQRSI